MVHIIFWFCCEKAASLAFKTLSHISSIHVYLYTYQPNEILRFLFLFVSKKEKKKTRYSQEILTRTPYAFLIRPLPLFNNYIIFFAISFRKRNEKRENIFAFSFCFIFKCKYYINYGDDLRNVCV